MRYPLIAAFAVLAATTLTFADNPTAKPAPAKPAAKRAMKPRAKAPMKPAVNTSAPIPGYTAMLSQDNIAPTATTPSKSPPKVYGEPRTTVGHPCTLWDEQDIAHYKEMLKTSKTMQEAFAKLKTAMDARIAEPLNVPVPEKGPDGEWMYLGTQEQYKKKNALGRVLSYTRVNENNVADISNLGTMYALTGDAKYGDFAKKMLLAYATGLPKYGHPDFAKKPWTKRAYRSAVDGRLTGQFLEDGTWLIQAARGYDLVYNLPSWTDAERKQIHDDLLKAVADEFTDPIISDHPYTDETHNRSVLCNAGVLMAGYATDDQKLIDIGLYGRSADKDHPSGGVFGRHFTHECISPDGMWNEGSMGYQNMALDGLIDDAETLWHHGYNMYSYNDGILKGLFNAEILMTYPDLTFPAIHDSERYSIIPTEAWNDDGPHTFEYAYLRYHDPRYLVPVTPLHLTLRQSIHDGPTSILFDVDLDHKPVIKNTQSVNFFDVGYGILRLPAPVSTISLLMQCGPSRSHGHPDKLSIDLYALGDVVSPDPGVIFPYGAKLDVEWYWTTPGHAAMAVDEKPEIDFANHYKMPRGTPDSAAMQTVFAPAQTLGMQRGYSDSVYPGTTEDRSLFLTPNYMADIYAGFSNDSHTYDNCWHLRGKMTTELALKPFTFPAPVANGYNALTDTKDAKTSDAFNVTVTQGDHPVRLFAAGGTDTQVITGGGFNRLEYPVNGSHDESVPAVFERRIGKDAIFGNVLDISGGKDAYVKSVTQEGSLKDGYTLLKIQTVAGTDLCFTSFRPGTYKVDGLETDAQQAFVRRDGDKVRAMYLAGGKTLKVGDAILERSEPGLACVEKLANGDVVVSNPSPTDASITLTLPEVTAKQLVKAGSTVNLSAKDK